MEVYADMFTATVFDISVTIFFKFWSGFSHRLIIWATFIYFSELDFF